MRSFHFPFTVVFQSTLPVGGATRLWRKQRCRICISIHAPRGGSDLCFVRQGHDPAYFNPRSPWGERLWMMSPGCTRIYFNPRSPWGERHVVPRAGVIDLGFQSTLPVGGATFPLQTISGSNFISIHAPRGGSDHKAKHHNTRFGDFNPRSPWGERLDLAGGFLHIHIFQSTLPVGGATILCALVTSGAGISIHAPRGGSDSKDAQFYPRIFGEKVNFECDFLVNSRCLPVS